MRLVVTSPTAVVLEADDVVSVAAEDVSGCFGILPGHADFLTVLAPSVVSYRDRKGAERHVGVHGGVLTVRQGKLVEVATRHAIPGDDLKAVEANLMESVAEAAESEQRARTDLARLQLAAIRHIRRYLEAARPGAAWLGEPR